MANTTIKPLGADASEQQDQIMAANGIEGAMLGGCEIKHYMLALHTHCFDWADYTHGSILCELLRITNHQHQTYAQRTCETICALLVALQ